LKDKDLEEKKVRKNVSNTNITESLFGEK